MKARELLRQKGIKTTVRQVAKYNCYTENALHKMVQRGDTDKFMKLAQRATDG